MAITTKSRIAPQIKLTELWPLVVPPIATVLFAYKWPSWVFMWAFAFSIYAGLKWLSFANYKSTTTPTFVRSLAYLLLWPGMDANSFFSSREPDEFSLIRESILAVSKLALGLVLIVVAVMLVDHQWMIAGWIGMAGIVLTLHFGLFHLLLVIFWRAGIDSAPIMDAPILASSLSDFWGKRWNLAFRDLSHTFVFRPCVGRLGVAGATMAVFVVSGVVHDTVISVPAGGGFGLPTLYFAIQGVGILFERSRLGKRLGTRKGVLGRSFCAVVILGPIFLLFHRPFVELVVIPMLTAIGTMWS